MVQAPITPEEPSNQRPLGAGRRMFGRYLIQRILGQGGMGVVWLARDEKLDRLVALKFLPDVCFLDAAARDDLKRETRRSLELTHPNIVRIYDFVEDDEAAAISMEFVDGATLSHLRIQREQRCFEPADLTRWMADLFRALDYAHHSACVVHRDLKPGNLMVTERGMLKVADFGIACGLQNTAARISAWNSSGGTLGYMSPQQLAGELAAPSDDLYSVGALLYELLTGKPPFHSGDLSFQIRTVTPESVAERRRKLGITGAPIPEAWEKTLAACLSKTPGERPATARDIAQRLGLEVPTLAPHEHTAPEMRTMIHREPAQAAPPPMALSLTPQAKRWLGLAAVTLAMILGASVAAFFLRSHAEPKTGAAFPVAIIGEPPGGIILKTDPSGAQVKVGAEAIGVTPVALEKIPTGAHAVEIQLAGFEPASVRAQVRSGQFTDLGLITLRRSTGTLQVVTDPQDSNYSLLAAGSETVIRDGYTPDTIPQLPTGTYRVRFQRHGWPVEEEVVRIDRERTWVARHQFAMSTLVIVSDPPGAEISLAGSSLGSTPLRASLPNGRKGPFTASLPGYVTATFDAELASGKTTTVPPFILKPEPPVLRITSIPPGAPFRLFAGAFESPNAEPIGSGTTPAAIQELVAGAYRIVAGDGHWPERSMTVQVAARGISSIELTFPHGMLKVESQPPGAEIFAGDDSLGTAPLEVTLSAGKHVITAEFNDRTARPRAITLAADDAQVVRFDFLVTKETTARKPRHLSKKKPEATAFTKIGRSISSFFTGQKPKK